MLLPPYVAGIVISLNIYLIIVQVLGLCFVLVVAKRMFGKVIFQGIRQSQKNSVRTVNAVASTSHQGLEVLNTEILQAETSSTNKGKDRKLN